MRNDDSNFEFSNGFLQEMLTAFLATAVLADLAPVTLVQQQGDVNCSTYGKRFVKEGLDNGIGQQAHVKLYLKSSPVAGVKYNQMLHSWVACSNEFVVPIDDDYDDFPYRVATCADTGKSVIYCFMFGVPCKRCILGDLTQVHTCMANDTLRDRLVSEMHAVADRYDTVPTVLLRNQSVPTTTPASSNDPRPLLDSVCKLKPMPTPLPDACNNATYRA